MQTSEAKTSTVTVIDEVGEHSLAFAPGGSLLKLLQEGGISVAAVCGGTMSCGTCHVILGPDLFARLSPPTEDETVLLEESRHYRPEASRLACQVPVSDALESATVTVAPDE